MTREGEYVPLYDCDFEIVRGHMTDEGARLSCTAAGHDMLGECWVEHTWARFVPSANWSDYDTTLGWAKGPSRGAFPVTVLREKVGI